jgi:hypothetical protein
MAKRRAAAAAKKSKPKKRKSARRAAAPRSSGGFASGHRQSNLPGALRPSVRKLGVLSKYLKTPHDRQRYNLAVKKAIADGFDDVDAKRMALDMFVGESFIEEGQAADKARTEAKKKEVSALKKMLGLW